MESCDVLVVGGGPAGSSLAWKLRKVGYDVLILDKSVFPRDKVCAGWVTPDVFKALGIDPEEYSKDRVLQPITAFRTGMIGESGVVTEYGRPVSYGVRRAEFDNYLLERCGARLRLGEPLKSLYRRHRNGHWIVNESISTSLVVGAGGHFCPVSRFMNADNGQKEAAVVAQEVEFEMDLGEQQSCGIRPDMPELYFCDDLKGYGWCFRKGNYLNIGLGRQDRESVARHVDSFCNFLKERGKVSNIPLNPKGHAYLLYQPGLRKLLDDGLMLVGDAAGLAYPQSGEGIRPAVESGLFAADAIIAAGGNYMKSRLQLYHELLRKRFGNGNPRNSLAMLPETMKNRIAHRLMATKWFSRHIVLNRWFLHSHQPTL